MNKFKEKILPYFITILYTILIILLFLVSINEHRIVEQKDNELKVVIEEHDNLIKESNSKYADYENMIDNLQKTIKENNNKIIKLQKELDKLSEAKIEIKESIEKQITTEEATTEEIITTEEITTEEQITEAPITEEIEQSSNGTYLGTYTLTAYMETGNPCADGAYPQVGYTCACNDPSLWHKWIYIEGYGNYYVHDVGGMPSYNIIDIYLGTYDACVQFGCQSANIYVIE